MWTASQINKAGRILRRWWSSPNGALLDPTLEWALKVLFEYRASHRVPLAKATMGVRSIVRTVGCQNAAVSQRLKRMTSIIDKLARQPAMALVTMQDVAGCRAILADLSELRRVQQ